VKKTYFCKYASGNYILRCEEYVWDNRGQRQLKSPLVFISFQNFKYETGDPEMQKLIESCPYFGPEIAILHSEEVKVAPKPVETSVEPERPTSGPAYSSGPMAVGAEVEERDTKGRFSKKK